MLTTASHRVCTSLHDEQEDQRRYDQRSSGTVKAGREWDYQVDHQGTEGSPALRSPDAYLLNEAGLHE